MTQVRWIDTGGFRCCYQVIPAPEGTPGSHRPPLFFVGGAFQSLGSWRTLAEAMAPAWTVVVADLPGTGSAGRLPYTHNLDVLADAIGGVLDDMGERQAYVISASYGSAIAYRFAQKYPGRVHRLILAGVMKEMPARWRSSLHETLALVERGEMKPFCDLVASGLLQRDPEKPVRRSKVAERLLRSGLHAMPEEAREQYMENTKRLLCHEPLDLNNPPRVPTLVVTGEHDIFTTPEACLEVARAIPNCWYTTIRQADHLFHLEQFEASVRLFLKFGEGQTPYLDPDLGPWSYSSPSAGWNPRQTAGLRTLLAAQSGAPNAVSATVD